MKLSSAQCGRAEGGRPGGLTGVLDSGDDASSRTPWGQSGTIGSSLLFKRPSEAGL